MNFISSFVSGRATRSQTEEFAAANGLTRDQVLAQNANPTHEEQESEENGPLPPTTNSNTQSRSDLNLAAEVERLRLAPAPQAPQHLPTKAFELPNFNPSSVHFWIRSVNLCIQTYTETYNMAPPATLVYQKAFNKISEHPETVNKIQFDLMNCPTNFPALSQILIKRVGKARQEMAREILHPSILTLGDLKPTELLDRMLRSVPIGEDSENWLLREIFISRLPRRIWSDIYAVEEDMNLRQVAELADRCMRNKDGYPEQYEVANINNSRSGHKGGRPPRPPSGKPLKPNLCWYHSEFGHKAFKCNGTAAMEPNKPCGMKNVPLATKPPNMEAGRRQQ